MQFNQMLNDPLPPLSQQGLGWWGAAAMMAAEAMKKKNGGGETDTGPDGTTNMPGGNPSVPKQPSSVTTVSPAIQTTISPQISPTMVQQQDSPGANVEASPMQYMPGGQSADTGTTMPGNYGAPGMPGTQDGISPFQPYGMDPYGNMYPYGPGPGQVPMPPFSVQGGPSPFTSLAALPWTTIMLIGGGLAAVYMVTKKKRRNGAR